MNVQSFDRGTYFDQLSQGPDAYIFYYAWPVPVDVVTLFVSTATIPAPNWAHASIPDVDAAIAAWQSAANEDELKAAAAQFQTSIAQHLPIIPLLNRNNIWVNRKTVHGYLPHQWNLYPYYNDVWLDSSRVDRGERLDGRSPLFAPSGSQVPVPGSPNVTKAGMGFRFRHR